MVCSAESWAIFSGLGDPCRVYATWRSIYCIESLKVISLTGLDQHLSAVIRGHHEVASPEPILTDRGYGFRSLGLQPCSGMTDQ